VLTNPIKKNELDILN